MADSIAVARKRSIAESRLQKAVSAASETFGVPFTQVPPITKREPALAAAHLIENVADFIERLNQSKKARQK